MLSIERRIHSPSNQSACGALPWVKSSTLPISFPFFTFDSGLTGFSLGGIWGEGKFYYNTFGGDSHVKSPPYINEWNDGEEIGDIFIGNTNPNTVTLFPYARLSKTQHLHNCVALNALGEGGA